MEMQLNEVRLDTSTIEYMLTLAIRCPGVHAVAASYLTPEQFDASLERSYRTIWFCALEFIKQFGRVPDKESLSTWVVTHMRSDTYIDDTTVNEANDIIDFIYAMPQDDFVPDAGLYVLELFLKDRTVTQLARKAIGDHLQGSAPIPDLIKALENILQSHQRLGAIRDVGAIEVIPAEYEQPEQELIPTGNPVFDNRMSGGNIPGEVNIVLGPSGVCKTMCGVEIACNRAEAQQLRELENPGSGKLTVFITFEESSKQIRPRFWAKTASIDKGRAEKIKSFRELSRTGNLLEYEQIKFAREINAGQVVPGEFERLMASRDWTGKFLHVADFSGSRDSGGPVRGRGGVPEIAAYVDNLALTTRREIDTVVIDWAGICVRRYLETQAGGIDSGKLNIALTTFVDQVYQQVTARHKCVGWVMHQLAGDVNNKSPTYKFHHSEAEWCKSFAVNAWFAFVFGTKDPTTHSTIMRCTKTRRGEAMTEVICYIDGAFGCLVDGSGFLEVDPVSNRIARREEIARFEAPVGPVRRSFSTADTEV